MKPEPVWTAAQPQHDIIHAPHAALLADTQLSRFARFCAEAIDSDLATQEDLHGFSVSHFREFWRLFLEWSEIVCEGDSEPVCTGDSCEHARFFPSLRLSYVENLLSGTASGHDATVLTAEHADRRPAEHLMRTMLHDPRSTRPPLHRATARPARRWSGRVAQVDVVPLAGAHLALVRAPYVQHLAAALRFRAAYRSSGHACVPQSAGVEPGMRVAAALQQGRRAPT